MIDLWVVGDGGFEGNEGFEEEMKNMREKGLGVFYFVFLNVF